MNKVYIVLSRSNTLLAMLIRVFTGKFYNHASIAFEKDLNSFYSFGRKNPRLLLPAEPVTLWGPGCCRLGPHSKEASSSRKLRTLEAVPSR